MAVNLDGWANMLTGMGRSNQDKRLSTRFEPSPPRSRGDLESMYRGDGIVRRIIDIIPNEMVRQGWEIEGDPENLINAKFDEIYAQKKLVDAMKWARLYGGCLVVMGIDDGQDFDQPVNPNLIRDVKFLHLFDRENIDYSTIDLYLDPMKANFGQPQFYNVQTQYAGIRYRVHESRVLRFDGADLPANLKQLNDNWGDSVINAIYDTLRDYNASYANTSLILEDFVQTIVTIDGLSDMLASGQDDLVLNRVDIMNMSKHIARTIILDSTEKFEKKSSSVSGLEGLLDRFMMKLASVTGIPVSLLMGRSAAGMNATGENDIRNFYDSIKQQQNNVLKPNLEKLVKYTFLSKDGSFRGREPENWNIVFNPLWQLDELQEAEYRKKVAETDALYISNGVLDPSEVAISRFGGERYTNETKIDIESREVMPPNPEMIEGEQERRQNLNLEV